MSSVKKMFLRVLQKSDEKTCVEVLFGVLFKRDSKAGQTMPPPTNIHHHSPPPTTSQNVSTKSQIYPPPLITTHHQPKYIHHHPPPPTNSKNISTTTHHHPPPAKIYPPPTSSQDIFTCNFIKKEALAQVFSCEFCEISTDLTVASVRCRTASVCCRRKVAAVKIENLKTFIIKYYDTSKTYSVQFHLFYLVTFSYFYFFIHGFRGSRTIAPEKNCPQPQN